MLLKIKVKQAVRALATGLVHFSFF